MGILRGADSRHDELTVKGHAQAQTLARHIAALNPEAPRVYASTYTRTQQTAAPVAELLGVSVSVLEGIHEIDPGAWRGRPYSDLKTSFEELVGPDDSVSFPSGESQRDVADRFEAALKHVLDQPGTPIVVSHGGALTSVLIRLLRAPVVQSWRSGRFALDNTGLAELTLTSLGWRIENKSHKAQ